MTKKQMIKLFKKERDSFEFSKVASQLSERMDLCAFLLLDRLLPGIGDIISASEHDTIYLSIDCDELARVATEEDILDLKRCGVLYDESDDSLMMLT